MSNYYYIDLTLEFPEGPHGEITPAFFKKHITEAVKQLFGEVGSAVCLDLLKYNALAKRAILRVPKDFYVKLRSSLTLCGTYEGEVCVYKIHKAAPLLLNLLGDSRSYEH